MQVTDPTDCDVTPRGLVTSQPRDAPGERRRIGPPRVCELSLPRVRRSASFGDVHGIVYQLRETMETMNQFRGTGGHGSVLSMAFLSCCSHCTHLRSEFIPYNAIHAAREPQIAVSPGALGTCPSPLPKCHAQAGRGRWKSLLSDHQKPSDGGRHPAAVTALKGAPITCSGSAHRPAGRQAPRRPVR